MHFCKTFMCFLHYSKDKNGCLFVSSENLSTDKTEHFLLLQKNSSWEKSGCYFYYDAGKWKGTVSGNDNRPEVMFVKTSSSFYYAEQKLEIDYWAGQTVKQLVSFLLNI